MKCLIYLTYSRMRKLKMSISNKINNDQMMALSNTS